MLGRTQQSAKNLSLSRAIAVRDSVIAYAKSQGVALDPTQFAVVGHGITQPKTGICGSEPCAPKSEQEWQSNMRVEFRIIQMEAEASAFKPLMSSARSRVLAGWRRSPSRRPATKPSQPPDQARSRGRSAGKAAAGPVATRPLTAGLAGWPRSHKTEGASGRWRSLCDATTTSCSTHRAA